MGFISVCRGIPLPETLVYVFQVLDHVLLMVRLAFFYMGLFDPTIHDQPSTYDHTEGLGMVHLQSSPSPPITTYLIKKTLPVVEFGRLAKRTGRCKDSKPVCIICLVGMEEHHRIRELSNCSHVFHSGCLDQWVDKGHITCPVCRANLLPQAYGMKGGKTSWVVERISRLLGKDVVRNRIEA